MKHKTEFDDLIPGIGLIKVTFDNKTPIAYYSIEIQKTQSKIEFLGEKATELGLKLFNSENYKPPKIPLEKVRKFANESTGGNWETKTRHEENKLSRYFIAWYLVRHCKYSLSQAGILIGNYDHATVLHGLKELEKPDKYKSEYEIESFKKFKQFLISGK